MPKRINPRARHRRIEKYKQRVESEYSSDIRTYFSNQLDYILEQIESTKDLTQTLLIAIFSENRWAIQLSLLDSLVREFGERVNKKASNDAIDELDLDLEFNNRHPLYLQWIEDLAAREIKDIDDRTRAIVRDTIQAAVDEGLGRDAVARKLREAYDGFSVRRSKLIANNEVAEAYANGNFIMYQRANVKFKRWWTTNDTKVSVGCQDNQDEGIILMNQAFRSGHMVPPRHPNCRCDILPVLKR